MNRNEFLNLTDDNKNRTIAEKIFGLVEGKDFGSFDDHQWELNGDGEIDYFGYYNDFHNGPYCERCGYYYCRHCVKDDHVDDPCIVKVKDIWNGEDTWKFVMDKLLKNNFDITIDNKEGIYNVYFMDVVHVSNSNLNHAMILAVMEYLD